MAFDFRGELVGSIRAVPLGHGLTLTETLLATSPSFLCVEAHPAWEMGRLVMTPAFRGEPRVLRHCLFAALDYLNTQTNVQTLYAACTPVLARLYRRFGFAEFAREVALAGTEKKYSLISGPFDNVFSALSTLGAPKDQAGLAGISSHQHDASRHTGVLV